MDITKRHDLIDEYEKEHSTFFRTDLEVKQSVYITTNQPDKSTAYDDFLEHAYGDIAFLLDLTDRAINKVKELQDAIKTRHDLPNE